MWFLEVVSYVFYLLICKLIRGAEFGSLPPFDSFPFCCMLVSLFYIFSRMLGVSEPDLAEAVLNGTSSCYIGDFLPWRLGIRSGLDWAAIGSVL